MKTFLPTIAFMLVAGICFAQPRIKYDFTSFDYGQLTKGGTLKKEFPFTNVGNEPLVIDRTYTGDGGSWAEFPKEPIGPGKTGTITFIYDGSRIGPFQKTISLNCNAYGPTDLKVKGEIIYRPTMMVADSDEKNIGEINFNDVDTIHFELVNSGFENLHLSFSSYDYSEIDMFYYQIYSKDKSEKKCTYDVFYLPGEKIQFTVLLRNVYGNTGPFERKIFLGYNSHDTLSLKIKGSYSGKPHKRKIFDGSSVLFYENDKLVKRETYRESGNLEREDFFEDGYCVHSTRRYGEYFFKKGILISKKKKKD